jgi:hypothetical protein
MAIHTPFLVSRPGIDHITVGQHGAALVRDVEKIAVAFLTLLVFERGVSFLPLLFVVILFQEEMHYHVFGAVKGLGVEKINGVLGSRQMAVHAVCHETLLVVRMTGSLPGIVGKLDFMAAGTELGRRCAGHGVVREAEKRESNDEMIIPMTM